MNARTRRSTLQVTANRQQGCLDQAKAGDASGFVGLNAVDVQRTWQLQAFAVPRAGWAKAFEQFGIPKGHTGPAEEMFEAVNAGWMDLGVEGTERVAGTTSARHVFAAAQKAVTA